MVYPYRWTAYMIVDASPDFVFDFLTDPMRIGKYVPEHRCEQIISHVKHGKGVKSVWSMDDGSQWQEEIVEAERPWHIVFIESRGTRGEYFLKPSADGKGTELDYVSAGKHIRKTQEWHRRHINELLASIKRNVETEYKQQ